MSSFGIVDFVANNLLDELGVNPAWEKFRKYIYTAGVGISLFALYVSLGVKVECAPAYSNGSVIRTDMQPRHVNEYCRNSDSKVIRYSGCILLGMNAFVLLISSYWLYIPSVIDPLRTFAKVQKLVDEINLPWKDIKRLVSSPMDCSRNPTSETNAEQRQLRQVIKLLPSFKAVCNRYNRSDVKQLASYRNGSEDMESEVLLRNIPAENSNSFCGAGFSGIAKYYVWRCFLLFTTLLLFAIGSTTLTIFIGLKGDTFRCTYDLRDRDENYVCTMDVRFVAATCSSVFAILLIFQMMATGYGVREAMRVIRNENRRSIAEIKYPSIMLIVSFWKSSLPSNSGILGNLIEFFFSKEFREAVEHNARRCGCSTDDELSTLSRALYMDNDPLQNLRFDHREYDSEQFRNIIHVTKYRLKDYKLLAAMLAKHELWETFVILLENVEDLNTCSEDDKNDFKESIPLNFDSLASKDAEISNLSRDFYETSFPYVQNRYSLLHYATDMKKRKNFDAANFLLSSFKPPNPYVHYSRKDQNVSEAAADYVSSPANGYKRFVDYESLLSNIRVCEVPSNDNPHYQCQRVLQDMLEKYRSGVNRFSIKTILCRRKFRVWDATASEFLKLAAENRDRVIETALLRSYFPGHPLRHLGTQGCIPSEECFGDIFRSFDYELEDCKNMAKTLAENRSWRLLAGLLNNTKTRCDLMTDEQLEFFRKLNIDLKERQNPCPRNESTRNFVLEALHPFYSRRHDDDSFTVAHFLLGVSKPQLLLAIDNENSERRLSSYVRDEIDSEPKDAHDFMNFLAALEKFEMESMHTGIGYSNDTRV